ncbi:DNA polymerase III subunit delta' [Thermoactinomyces mirandus]|uniref:DNA polymerase III subunit delta n=1 Tax=Thermoactinomyces mirandus TaxID=2756294 RepID=A0A7W2AST8_9BACL|nr:DNA polymerase III subunit delta' [Thermoactinomyces mirandus]MBA4602826.1 DNA polymerase III subunit delta' [Thermoactinomyces mirandus]
MSDRNLVQPQLLEILRNAFRSNRLAHAYIFYGPKDTGKRELALELAKTVNCERQEGSACGKCSSCIQIEQGNHPDVVMIRPDGNVIKIAQLRQLQSRFRYSAPEGVTRVAVLEEADKMRAEAANSLLKFLEEPYPAMMVILITERLADILSTIRSRCQLVRFPELSPSAKAARYLKMGIPEHLARLFANLPYRFDVKKEELDRIDLAYQKVMEWGSQILSSSPEAIITLSEPWFVEEVQAERTHFLLDILLLFYRDLLLYPLKGETEIFHDSSVGPISAKQPSERIVMAMDNVLIARRLLGKSQLSWQGILEQMILSIQQNRLSMENGWQLIPLSKV